MNWYCAWHTGPDAGGTHRLPEGRHLVGRARTAAVRCDDPTLLPHHLLLDVRADGSVRAEQLAGRVPVRHADGTALREGPATLPDGALLEVGSSVLQLRRGDPPVHAPATVRADGVLVRAPRAVPTWVPACPVPPEPLRTDDEPVGGLLPALLGVAGAAVMAMLLHQLMFLLFGLMGALVAVGSWVAQHVARRRRRAQRRHEHAVAAALHADAVAADREAFVAAHTAAVPSPASVRATFEAGVRAPVWSRRAEHGDAFVVSMARGAVAHPNLDAPVADLPVPVVLGPGARVAVTGPGAHAVARSAVVQLAASAGPADVRLVVLTRQPSRWACVAELPHLQLPDGTAAVVDESGLADVLDQLAGAPAVVVVTDAADALATRTGALRRALDDRLGLLAVLPDDPAPQLCTAVLTLQHGPLARWVPDTVATLLPEPVRVTAMGERAVAECCAALAALRDPEDVLTAHRLPREVTLADVVDGVTADDVARRWRDAVHEARTPIGLAADGMVDLDLVRDGPHGLLAGTTGSGKSELLRSLVVGLALHVPPHRLQMVLVDYKGGATFDGVVGLPHVAGVVTDLDDALADRALRSLHAELRRREHLLREHGVADVVGLRERAPEVLLPRLLVVIDEFAALVQEQPEFLHALVGVAQRGRSLGVHLLLATQRPNGVISDDIRANTELRLALRLLDGADAVDVVGDVRAAHLPRSVPGRAVMRLGAAEHLEFQTARVGDTAAMVAAVCEAAAATGAQGGPPPWLPPLPERLERHDVADGAIGWCDDPDHQRRVELRWRPDDGNVVVAGGVGTGVSSTLRTLAAQALATDGHHVYVLVAGDDAAWGTLATHPRCEVVPLHDAERTMRLARAVQRRHRVPAAGEPGCVLVVDGLDVVRRSLDDVATAEVLDAFECVIAGDGAVTVVAGMTGPAAAGSGLLSRTTHRWLHHLPDALDAGAWGVSPRAVPGPVAGRVVVASTGLQAQLVVPPAALQAVGRDRGAVPVERIAVVPDVVDDAVLDAGRRVDDEVVLPVGLDVATGAGAALVVPDGEHVLVVGGGRSGRSTVLVRLAAAWREAHPDGRVIAVLPRRSSFPAAAADRVVRRGDVDDALAEWGDTPLLVVVDDAELVDDTSGALARLVSGRGAGVTVVAAGRAESLRHRYGHWTTAVRHSRLGLVAVADAAVDGELLGAALPHRAPVRVRPGCWWVVDHDGARLVQVAQTATRSLRAQVAL
ncbi:MAG: hypothetical protein RL238_2590 [Actinomycetota bacterium]|jgi:S-DNA-T family DNA segregation ATPase FtsK/SpoIIIE